MANIQTDVFVVDKSGTLNVQWVVEAGAWGGPLGIGPAGFAPAGAAVAVSQQFGAVNQTDAFVVDNAGQLNVFWVNSAGAWGGPLGIGPAGFAPPGAAVAVSQQFGAANQTDVFVVDNAGQLNVFWVNSAGAWGGPLGIGQAGIFPPGAPVAASQQFGLNQTDVFVVDKNGTLNVLWVVDAGAWSGPGAIGPAGIFPPGAPVVASQQFGAVNQTDVFVVDKAGQLNVFWVNNAGAWGGPLGIGPAGFAPAGASVAASQQFGAVDQTDVFVVDKSGQLNVFWVNDAGAWGGPLGIGPAGFAPSGASVAASQQFGAVDQTDVFVVDKSGQLNVFWVNDAGAWGGPLGIGPAGFAPAPALVAASQQYGVNVPPPPPTQFDYDTGIITFGGGVAAQGSAHLTIHQDGSYQFTGQFHDSGAISYNDVIALAFVDSNKNVYTFARQGSIAGTFEAGSRDDLWDITGQNDTIANNWTAISASGFYYKASISSELSQLISSLLSVIQTIAGVVQAVFSIVGPISSSRRFKKDIQNMGDTTANLMRLRPVTYRFKQPFADGNEPVQYGLIAEEVAEVYPELVAHSADGQIETVKYQVLDSMLLNELQKQQKKINEQGSTIHLLELRLAALEGRSSH